MTKESSVAPRKRLKLAIGNDSRSCLVEMEEKVMQVSRDKDFEEDSVEEDVLDSMHEMVVCAPRPF